MDLGIVIPWLYQQVVSMEDYLLIEDPPGSAQRLVYWHEEKLGPRPTEAQLRDAWLPALKAQKIAEIRSRAAEEAEKVLPLRQAVYLTRTRASLADARLTAWEAVCKKERDLIGYINNPARTEPEVAAVHW